MNIHHLELFYYVARHGGISEAVRNIPYGIQQPAVSGQVIQLERSLGVVLFRRRPFDLTPAGRELYAFVQPFFDNVQSVAEKLRGGMAQHVRIGASEIVLRDHLPAILRDMRRQFPKLKVTLRQGYHPQLERMVEQQEIDLSIALVVGKPPPGVSARRLFQLAPVLMVPRSSRLKSAEDLWAQDPITETLISVPVNEPVCRTFQEGLARRKIDWLTGIEVSSLELVQTYVVNGDGVGLTVAVPKAKYHPQVRLLPLEGFEPIDFGVMWHGRPSPIVQAFIAAVEAAARKLLDA